MARLDDMVHRILRSMFAVGVVDDPPVRTVVDPFRGLEDAQHIAEESIVLLKNSDRILPLKSSASVSIAIIGSHCRRGRSLRRWLGAGRCAGRQRSRSGTRRLQVGPNHLLPFLAAEVHSGEIAAVVR